MTPELWDAHLHIPEPMHMKWDVRTNGSFRYFHYGCDSVDDRVSQTALLFFFTNLFQEQSDGKHV